MNDRNLLQDTALTCLKQTRSVWRQQNGETLEMGFLRVFGRPLPPESLLTVGLSLGGRIVTVHLHSGGIAAVYDPASGGWELRALKPEHNPNEIANRAAALREASPIAQAPTAIVLPGQNPVKSFQDWTLHR